MAEKVDLASSIITAPPIYKLDVDTLWKIFWMNTDMFATMPTTARRVIDPNSRMYPMDDLRRASQVCRFLREVALGSPVLWGQIIELDGLPGRVPWGRELLARAAHAPLCIKGTQRQWEYNPECCLFFTELLDRHWASIQKFDILIFYRIPPPIDIQNSNGNQSQRFRTPLTYLYSWEPLYRPAPTLESFSLIYNHSRGNVLAGFDRSDALFFADSAPLLRSFTLDATSTGVMNVARSIVQAPWLRSLRSLALAKSFQATQILDILTNTRHLENLRVNIESANTAAEEGLGGQLHDRMISLPMLRQLNIKGTFYAVYTLLQHIRPSTICSLDLQMVDFDVRDNPAPFHDSDMAADQISRYVQSLLSRHHIFLIKNLVISNYHVEFQLVPSDRRCSSNCTGLTIRYFSSRGMHVGSVISHFLIPLLTSHQFTHLGTLNFGFSRNLDRLANGVSAVLSTLFCSLHSITQIKIPNKVLQLMPTIPPDTQSAWIQALELEPEGGPPSEGASELLLCFLRRQVEIGKPVGSLRIASREGLDPDDGTGSVREYMGDWGFLDEIHGLRVVWGDGGASGRNDRAGGEYICGSGDPETLDFDAWPASST